jgi:hypothetical protein
MARPTGSKNAAPKVNEIDSECKFLLDAVNSYIYWKDKVNKLEAASEPADKERDFARTYKLTIHAFTADETDAE